MAERIKAAIKSPEILELVNICVINALGYKSKISSKTVDNAIDSIVSFVHSLNVFRSVEQPKTIRNIQT